MSTRKLKMIVFLFALCTLRSFGNPIPPPTAIISELKYDRHGAWILEITFRYGTAYEKQYFDSISVATSGGISRIKLDHLQDGTQLFVITPDSLEFPITINSDGDCLKLYSHTPFLSQSFVDSIPFGNYPGSLFEFVPDGYSICRFEYNTFYKDKSPTIGAVNDSEGGCGTLSGNILDKNGAKVKEGAFYLDNMVTLNGDGTYATVVYARKFVSRYLTTKKYLPSETFYHAIDSLAVTVEPDTIVERDIHFKDFIVSVQNEISGPSFDFTVINYPNPFNASTNFVVRIPNTLRYDHAAISIYSVTGEHMGTLPVLNGSPVRWNGTNADGEIVSSGTYYYQVLMDGKVMKSGSMVFLK